MAPYTVPDEVPFVEEPEEAGMALTNPPRTSMPDINSPELQREVVLVDGVDPEEFFKPPLPDDGLHKATLALGDRGCTRKKQRGAADPQNCPPDKRTGPEFLDVHIVATFADDDTQPGMIMFDNLNSIKMPNGQNRLVAAMALAGCQGLGWNDSLEILEKKITLHLAQAPRVGVVTEWEAQVEDETKPEGSRERYRRVKTGQKHFPPILNGDPNSPNYGKETGRYDPEIFDPESGKRTRARSRIVRYQRI